MPEHRDRILVIDDEPQILSTVERYLRSLGHDVMTAEDAESGLALMQRKPADIVLTDIRMPGMDGLDLLSQLRKQFPATDVILISGHGQMRDAIEAIRRGAFDYIQKPFDLDELEVTLNRALEKRHDRERLRSFEEQLYHAQKMEALGTLAGGVAHEFNNLMGGIIGYNTMALESTDPKLIRKALDTGLNAAGRAAEIARNLLHFAQRERHHKASTDINQILLETLELVRSDLQGADIHLETGLGDVPPVEIDASQFQQVFLNLIVNAREALADADTADKRLTVTSTATAAHVDIRFADSGPGVPPDQRHRIFEPFFTTRGVLSGGTNTKSTGLGLSVADGIVRGHGGEIHCEDGRDGGACFVVRIPLQTGEHSRPHRILVVDDEDNVRRIMQTVLAGEGFELMEANSGETALKMIQETDFDLVLLDQLMPGMSGLDVLNALGDRLPDLPVVMVTGLVQEELARDAVLAGARECVFKPINTRKLLFLARKYCSAMSLSGLPGDEQPHFRPGEKLIMVVDENPVIRDVYRLVLGGEGYKVTTLSCAREALDMTDQEYYDLIIIDARTRDMEGQLTIRAIRANNPYTPVLISTGHTTEDIVQAGLRAGASQVIQKPVDPAKLLRVVGEIIGLYQK